MTDWSLWLVQLLRTLRNLASGPDAQKAFLVDLGTGDSADELALEFDDMYRPLVHQFDELNVPHSTVEKLARLDGLLDEMSGPQHAELWESDALQTSEQWSEVRRLAADVISDLDGMTNG
jgi:hypothetical protein